MKKFFIFIFLASILISCGKDEYTSNLLDKDNGSLVSPKGFVIAKDMESLKEFIKPDVEKIVGKKGNIRIEDIRYMESKDRSIAFIDFITEQNTQGTIAISNMPRSDAGKVTNRTDDTRVKIYCEGSCGCRIVGSFDNGVLVQECECSDCVMTVEVID